MGPVPKRKTERAPAVDRLLKPAVGIVIAMVAYFVRQGLQSEIVRVDVEDELALREVFFGEGDGKDYVVLCHTEDVKATSIPISSVFQDARNDGSVKAEFVLMDCNHVLPTSNKTVADRFGIDVKKRPTIFVSGRVGAPKQVPLKHLKTGNMLVKVLRGLLEPHAAKIENTKALKSKCLAKDYCALFFKGAPVEKYVKEAIQNLIVEHPNVQFASVDSTVLLLTNLENSDVNEFTRGQHRFVVFKKVSGSLEAGNNTDSSRLITSIAAYNGRNYQHGALSNFVHNAVSGKGRFTKLPALPTVKTRTKKLEEQERKKWQRARERRAREEQQKQQQQQAGAFSHSQAEPGSKEARKAERDRLREEHRKEHNVPDLTPEEIAERERARRQRMEEQAAQWNIMSPEDEEAQEQEQQHFDVGDGTDDGREAESDQDGEEDDEEDVLDLD